jgi:hypothetical protein
VKTFQLPNSRPTALNRCRRPPSILLSSVRVAIEPLGRFVNVLPPALFFEGGTLVMLSIKPCEFFLKLVQAGQTVWGKFAGLRGGAHRTAGFVLVLAVAKAATPCQGLNFVKC